MLGIWAASSSASLHPLRVSDHSLIFSRIGCIPTPLDGLGIYVNMQVLVVPVWLDAMMVIALGSQGYWRGPDLESWDQNDALILIPSASVSDQAT